MLLVPSMILDISFSFLFMLSAYHKLVDLRGFREVLYKEGIVNSKLLLVLPALVIGSELYIVLGYAGGWMQRTTSFFTLSLLVIFSAYLIVLRRQEGVGCKCFGDNSALNRYPLVRNGVLLSLVAIDMNLTSYHYVWHETVIVLLFNSAVLMYYLVYKNVKSINRLKTIGIDR